MNSADNATLFRDQPQPGLVSVLLPVYNGERYVREAVDSMLLQTYGQMQVVIVDDGSTDQTPAILASYDDPRLKIVRCDNAGITKALNFGLGFCSGEYICRMDADDVSLPERIERQMRRIRETGADVVWCNADLIDEEGTLICRRYQPSEKFTVSFLKYCNFILHPGVIMTRRCLEAVGGYDETYGPGQDYALWKVMHANGARFTLCDEPLLLYRITSSSISSTHFSFPSERRTRDALVCLKNRDRRSFWRYYKAGTEQRMRLFLRYLIGEQALLGMRIALRYLGAR